MDLRDTGDAEGAARDEGIERAAGAMEARWNAIARDAIRWCAERWPKIMVDDVWDRVEATTELRPGGQGMAGIFKWAASKAGGKLIEVTQEPAITRRKGRHKGTVRFWRSNVYRPGLRAMETPALPLRALQIGPGRSTIDGQPVDLETGPPQYVFRYTGGVLEPAIPLAEIMANQVDALGLNAEEQADYERQVRSVGGDPADEDAPESDGLAALRAWQSRAGSVA